MLNKNGERELAYVVRIDDITPIDEADRVELAHVGGWTIMVRKDQFKKDDYAIYFEIDSKVPEVEPFKFLEPKHYKVKTQKYFKGKIISQGLLMSFKDFEDAAAGEDLPDWLKNLKDEVAAGKDIEHTFLTQALGVIYSVDEDNKRKKSSAPDKYRSMVTRKPNIFAHPLAKWFMKRDWGRKFMFFLFGKKKDNARGWPTGRFPGVTRTDQERCLIAQTKILTDKGVFSISQIVNKKMPVKVLSMNPDGTTSFKKILDYQKFNNPSGDVVTIEYPYKVGAERVNHLCCTLDHKIYTQKGYIEAKDIKIGDYVYKPVECYSDDAIEAIYGMLLGNSHIAIDKRTNGLLQVITTNGEAQLDYLKYKQSIFNNGEGTITNAGKDKTIYHYNLPVDPYIDKVIREDILINNKKCVTNKWLDKLTEVSLAFWYMDDGSLSHKYNTTQKPSIRLNTQGFSKKENDLLCECLNNKFEISCHAIEENRNDKTYYHIYVDTNGTPKFLQLVTPYMCESMKYKTTIELESIVETKCLSFEKNKKVLPVQISNVQFGQHKNKSFREKIYTVYDLEVEDNHNFVADDIIVHNCENLYGSEINDNRHWTVTTKCDGTSATYILEKLKRNKYDYYVLSRNVRQLDRNQSNYHSDADNPYWEANDKYHIYDFLKEYIDKNHFDWACLQGEICGQTPKGTKIQGNPHKLSDLRFFGFHFTDSTNGRLDPLIASTLCTDAGIEWVPIVNEDYVLPHTMEEFKKEADGPCEIPESNGLREGYVYYLKEDPRVSFKNVSNKYLINHH